MNHELIIGGILILISIPMLYYFVRKRSSKVLEMSSLVYESLNDIVANTSCDRAIILKIENGGGKILLGSHKYGSVLFENHSDNVKKIKDNFQRHLLDREYIDMLLSLKRDGKTNHITGNMPPCLLKRTHIANNITCSVSFFLGETENAFYHIEMSSVSNNLELLKDKDFAFAEAEANKLIDIFRRARKKKLL